MPAMPAIRSCPPCEPRSRSQEASKLKNVLATTLVDLNTIGLPSISGIITRPRQTQLAKLMPGMHGSAMGISRSREMDCLNGRDTSEASSETLSSFKRGDPQTGTKASWRV